jgi:glucosaminylphosphatidylinositol acyltransferase
VADLLLNVGAILFATTVYSSAPSLLNLLLIAPAVLISLLPRPSAKPTKSSKPGNIPNGDVSKNTKAPSDALPVRHFLTTYRGAMMIVTCLAILAVDFRVFPRRFAKVENWGTSLMDLGVGSFVFSAGVVSARSVLKARLNPSSKTFVRRFVVSLRHSLPLFVLGFVRLWSVKGLDYAEHVTEYGVHWNFFFTLAFLPPFVELSDMLMTSILPSYQAIAFVFALSYEIVLNTTELKRYILVSPRGPDLLSKNREGVFSFIGYLAIFLAGRGTGMVVIPSNTPRSSKSMKPAAAHEHTWKDRKLLLRNLASRSIIWSLLFALSTAYIAAGLRVSRRLANLPYVLWVNAFNNSQLLLFCLIETFYFPETYKSQTPDAEMVKSSTSRIMEAFNKNGLAVFLVANLLTGLVNLTVPTLDLSSLAAMDVLIVYAAAITAFAVGLDWSGVKIKL